MEFWSKGLGRLSLLLALGEGRVEADAERIALSGNVSAPVTWNYIMYLERRDWTEFFELALRPEMASYLLCRRRLAACIRLSAFLAKFLVLYSLALARGWLGRAPEPAGLSVAPDLGARAQIDGAALAEMEDEGRRSARRPRSPRAVRGTRPAAGTSAPEDQSDPAES